MENIKKTLFKNLKRETEKLEDQIFVAQDDKRKMKGI